MNLVQATLRGFQLLFTLLTTALVGAALAGSTGSNTDSALNYAMFASVWCWLVLIVGVLALKVEILGGIVQGILDAVTVLVTFIAGVVLAARLRVHSCSNQSYLYSNSLLNSSTHPSVRCKELQASTAFYWFLFALFAATMALHFMNGGGSGMNVRGRGGMRKGGPTMAQV